MSIRFVADEIILPSYFGDRLMESAHSVLAPGRTDLRFANREWDQLFECDAGMKKAGGFLHRLASFQVLD